MKHFKILIQRIILFFVCLTFFSGCFLFEDQETKKDTEIIVTTMSLTSAGATHLLAYNDKIFIGHNTYIGGGCIQYYDPALNTVNATGITNTDVAKMAFHSGSNRLYFINGISTYFIDTSVDIESWSITEVTGGPAAGADMVLYNGNVYTLKTTWSEPYTNTLYIIDAGTATLTHTIDLNTGDPTNQDSLSKIGIDPGQNKLYFTDTIDGDIYSSPLDGTNITHETTTNSGSTGTIYFNNGTGYVLTGLTSSGNMGVHMFNTETPGILTTHFLNSADLSAQFMAFKDSNTAYITHYSGGVYEFDPSHSDSDFTILNNTDPQDLTGLQDILLSNEILYITVNNYPNESYLMIVTF